jgi:hypothetical protein
MGRLCLASDSGMLHSDSRGQSYGSVTGAPSAGRFRGLEILHLRRAGSHMGRTGISTECSSCDTVPTLGALSAWKEILCVSTK